MADPTNTPRQPELPSETHSAAERNRRRVIQRGLAAAPLLMTLLSRPVLGQVQCFAPSAAVSIPTSTHGATILCSGRAPGFWADPLNFSAWAAPYYPDPAPAGQSPTLFNAVFSVSPYASTTTLLQVLALPAGGADDVARYSVAALLNAQAGWTSPLPLPVPAVVGIWSEYASTGYGYFEPTAGVKRFQGDIVLYLKSTMPL